MFIGKTLLAAAALTAATPAFAAPINTTQTQSNNNTAPAQPRPGCGPLREPLNVVARDGTIHPARCALSVALDSDKRALNFSSFPHCPAIARDGSILATRCPTDPRTLPTLNEQQKLARAVELGVRELNVTDLPCPEIAREVATDFVARGIEDVAAKVQSKRYAKDCPSEPTTISPLQGINTTGLFDQAKGKREAPLANITSLPHCDLIARDGSISQGPCPTSPACRACLAEDVQKRDLAPLNLSSIAHCPAVARDGTVLVARCPEDPVQNPAVTALDKNITQGLFGRALTLGNISDFPICPAIARDVASDFTARGLEGVAVKLQSRAYKCPTESPTQLPSILDDQGGEKRAVLSSNLTGLLNCPVVARDGSIQPAKCPSGGPPPLVTAEENSFGKRSLNLSDIAHCPAIGRDGAILVARCPEEPVVEEQQAIQGNVARELDVRGSLGNVSELAHCPIIARDIAEDFATRGLEEVAAKVQSRAYSSRCPTEDPIVSPLLGAQDKTNQARTLNLTDNADCPVIARELSSALETRSLEEVDSLLKRVDLSKCPTELPASPLANEAKTARSGVEGLFRREFDFA